MRTCFAAGAQESLTMSVSASCEKNNVCTHRLPHNLAISFFRAQHIQAPRTLFFIVCTLLVLNGVDVESGSGKVNGI